MANTNSNLRKAAVLLRSVDADTAATLLAQLSPTEAESVRAAIRSLGSIDPDEQANVVTEFRRESPRAIEAARDGVELALSSSIDGDTARSGDEPAASTGKRFEFLEDAPASRLASYLAREHAQTVAVVLSHLAPARAAAVLAALPNKLQVEALERLSVLGETDAESVTVLERELAAWVRERAGDGRNGKRRRDAVRSILAAADAKTRDGIVTNLKAQNAALAEQIAPAQPERSRRRRQPPVSEYRAVASAGELAARQRRLNSNHVPQPPAPIPQPVPRFDFDRLTDLDGRTLARMLGAADPNVLALALAGSGDELVDRICEQMPKRIAKAFRRELRRLGPTRLSDVEAAQRAIAELAAQQLAERQATFAAVRC